MFCSIGGKPTPCIGENVLYNVKITAMFIGRHKMPDPAFHSEKLVVNS